LWDLSLVDPDNRRPVDFALRERCLREVAEGADPAEMLRNWQDGRIKVFLTHRGLQLRRELPHVFVGGDYTPLTVDTSVPGDAVAFARTSGNDVVVVIAARLCSRLWIDEQPVPLGGESWKTTRVLLP